MKILKFRMKKTLLLSLLCLLAFGCGDEIQFNTPAFQGDRENKLWRAKDFYASIETNGFLTIVGTNNIETVELKVPSATEGTYIVGDVNTIEAVYRSLISRLKAKMWWHRERRTCRITPFLLRPQICYLIRHRERCHLLMAI